jgi:hypothetical protein
MGNSLLKLNARIKLISGDIARGKQKVQRV